MSQEQKEILSQRMLTAEQGVLGSMLIDGDVVGSVLMAVEEDDFRVPEHRNVFRAFRELYGQGRAPDPILVNEYLGGAYGQLMAGLMEITPTAANAEEYARMLRESSRLWRLRELGDRLAQAGDLEDCRELADQANMLLCAQSGVRRLDMGQGWKDFFVRHDPKNRKDCVRWGLADLDQHLHVAGGDMVVIGGYASAGKTAFALQLAFHMAKERRVGFFSYETSVDKLHDRVVACQALASYRKIASDTLEKADFEQVYGMREQLSAPALEFLEASGMGVSSVGAYAMARHYDVIVVDYLQKLPAAGRDRRLSDFERVSQVSDGLQQLARRTGKVVVALSQLSRPDREGQPPTLSSLRQSGQIEQDADVVLLLYKEDPTIPDSRRNLDFAKNKDGLAGIGLSLVFDGDNQRFMRPSDRTPAGKRREAPVQQSIFRPVAGDGPTPFDEKT